MFKERKRCHCTNREVQLGFDVFKNNGWTLKKHFALENIFAQDPGEASYFAFKRRIIRQSKRERGFHFGPWKKESPKTYRWHAFLARWRSRCLDRSLWTPLWPSLCLAVRTLRVFIGISLGLTVSSKVAKCCLCMANLHEDLVTHCTCVAVFSLCWVLNFWQANK